MLNCVLCKHLTYHRPPGTLYNTFWERRSELYLLKNYTLNQANYDRYLQVRKKCHINILSISSHTSTQNKLPTVGFLFSDSDHKTNTKHLWTWFNRRYINMQNPFTPPMILILILNEYVNWVVDLDQLKKKQFCEILKLVHKLKYLQIRSAYSAYRYFP